MFLLLAATTVLTAPHRPERLQGQSAGSVLRQAKAVGVLLDWNTGKMLAAEGAEHKALPGSLLKPFLLAYALDHGIVQASTEVYCRRSLRVAGRALPCAHPADKPVFNAAEALAESCNTWFAALARRMSAQDMNAALSLVGEHPQAILADADRRVLTALGLAGARFTPMQLAVAYRTLLLNARRSSPVWNGLHGSVQFGMANNANVSGEEILGKTGTAQDAGEWWSHGWFAGGVPGRYVLVVYVPHGDGGTAASLAGHVFAQLARQGSQ